MGAVPDPEVKVALKRMPTGSSLIEMAANYNSDADMARALRVPRTTLRDHINAHDARATINALREQRSFSEPPPEEIPVIHRDYSNEETHVIYPLGDIHKGSQSHSRDRWIEWLLYLEGRRNASLLGTGDFLNSALKDSKSEAYDEEMTLGQAKRELISELQPMASTGRVDALCPGNHEDRVYRAVGDCPVKDIAESLSIPYFRAAALLVYQVGGIEYEVYLRHGTGNGQSLATLAKSGSVIKADIYVTGHTHRQAVTADDFFVRDGDKLVRTKRFFVSSGSFLGYENYAAARGYPPSRIGAPRIHLDGRRHDVHVSV
jgi:predicted phosphodiesterase